MKKLVFYSCAICFLIAGVVFLSGCMSKKERVQESAITYFISGNMEQAIISARLWSVNDPDNLVPHAILSCAYEQLGKHAISEKESSIAYTRETIEEVIGRTSSLAWDYRHYPYAHLLNGIAFEKFGDKRTAIHSYQSSIKVDASFKPGLENLARLYMEDGQLNDAIKIYSQIIEKYPTCGSAYESIGIVYVKKCEFERAEEYFDRAKKYKNVELKK